ncbi:MAG: SUMF1/EgtB/PvdO family nonheme iron enzyme [Gammaproteobacteria bacterium]|nr:SUMF1/EgtB/PvdO family nonheme iron enzyme [Gammaproteobacteria bacterium]
MALHFELAGAQIDGAREYQEDAFLITNLADKSGKPAALIIVADGMGGHAAGNVASNMAVQAFNKYVSANYPSDDLSEVMHEAILRANKAIKETVSETPALQGMGCTMVAAILEGGKIIWASVGDSHLYLIRGKELMKKNADHSYGGFLERMKAAGTPVEPEPGLAPNMLMSAITGDDINEIDVPAEAFDLQPGDRVLLCSDGIDTLSDGKIIQFSAWSEAPKECADALLQAVTDAKLPKQDNTTVVVVNVVEKAAAVAPAPSPPAPAPAAAPPPQPVYAAPSPAAAPAEREKKGNTGMIIGIAAAVMLAAGIGAYMTMGGKKPARAPADETAVVSEAPGAEEADAGTAEAEVSPPPEEAPVAEETAVAPAAETPAAPAAAAAPAPAPAAAGQAPAGGEFQDSLKAGGSAPAMVRIPAGSFEMGSSGSSRNAEERPRHSVKIDRFAMSKYEITFAEYEKFAAAAGRKLPDNLYLDKATHPVFFVTWDDAFYYAKWLTEQTGHKYRLPTEAEWEYAAGAGKTSSFWWGFDEEPNRGHCYGCGTSFDPRKPTKIGSFGANPFGLHDTGGNIAEWVADCWHDTYNGAPTDGGVWEGGDCIYRIARGGAFSSPPQSIRHAKRDRYKSDQMYDHIGIRLVREE